MGYFIAKPDERNRGLRPTTRSTARWRRHQLEIADTESCDTIVQCRFTSEYAKSLS